MGWVQAIAFSPDGTYLASSSDDESVKVWDIVNGQCIRTLEVGACVLMLKKTHVTC